MRSRPSSRRSCETYTWSAFAADSGGDSPQSPSISLAWETSSLALTRSSASSARSFGPPGDTARPSLRASIGPRIRNSMPPGDATTSLPRLLLTLKRPARLSAQRSHRAAGRSRRNEMLRHTFTRTVLGAVTRRRPARARRARGRLGTRRAGRARSGDRGCAAGPRDPAAGLRPARHRDRRRDQRPLVGRPARARSRNPHGADRPRIVADAARRPGAGPRRGLAAAARRGAWPAASTGIASASARARRSPRCSSRSARCSR